jgi:hypothetical protein
MCEDEDETNLAARQKGGNILQTQKVKTSFFALSHVKNLVCCHKIKKNWENYKSRSYFSPWFLRQSTYFQKPSAGTGMQSGIPDSLTGSNHSDDKAAKLRAERPQTK